MSEFTITVDQKELKKALDVAGKAVAGRSTLPVLSNILFASDGERLRVCGNNLEISITTGIVCRGDAFAITLPAKTISDYIGALSPGLITLTFDDRTQSVAVSTGKSQSKIKGIEADEFPNSPAITGDGIVFDAFALGAALRTVAVAAAAEHTNPILQGVNIAVSGNSATFAAIDGYRLNVRTIAIESATENAVMVTLPARSVIALASLLSSDAPTAEMVLSESGGMVVFRIGDTVFTSRVIDGKFPEYERFVPTEESDKTRIIIDTAVLIAAVKRVALFATSAGNIIKLETLTSGSLTLSANAAEVGDAAESVDTLDEKHEPRRTALNIKYLQEALSTIGTKQVAIDMASENSPTVLKPVGDVHTGVNLSLVMPMRIPG